MSNYDELQILRDMRDLLEPPENWTQNWYARDAKGSETNAYDPNATCWCLRGAAMRVIGPEDFDLEVVLEGHLGRFVTRRTGGTSVANFNDDHTHREVLELLDEAIAGVIAERTAT